MGVFVRINPCLFPLTPLSFNDISTLCCQHVIDNKIWNNFILQHCFFSISNDQREVRFFLWDSIYCPLGLHFHCLKNTTHFARMDIYKARSIGWCVSRCLHLHVYVDRLTLTINEQIDEPTLGSHLKKSTLLSDTRECLLVKCFKYSHTFPARWMLFFNWGYFPGKA